MMWLDLPTCPRCLTQDDCWHEQFPDEQKMDGDEWITTCPACGGAYGVTLCVSTTFETFLETFLETFPRPGAKPPKERIS